MYAISDIARLTAEIEADFQRVPGLILSEDDAKCLLFGKLYEQLSRHKLHQAQTADNGTLASAIHTEIKFLDSSGTLSIRPDISILDTSNLSLHQSRNEFDISRKGFVFWGSATIIEIKFCKARRGIDKRFTDRIRSDCQKIEDLRNRLYPLEERPQLNGVVAVFNRSNLACAHFRALASEYSNNPHIRVVYATANFNYASHLQS